MEKRLFKYFMLIMTVALTVTFNACSENNEGDEPKDPEQSEEAPEKGKHEYVDLGLSVKWATMNIGAEKPSDYGDYFAWGETETTSNYIDSNSKWCDAYSSFLKSQGVIDSNGNLTSQYDAATVNWGGSWRMPTLNEIKELLNKCEWTWTIQDGHKGYKVSGPSGNSIFLPAAGYRYGIDLIDAGSIGNYWSSTDYSNSIGAHSLAFNSSDYVWGSGRRFYGHSIRPVKE